MALTERETDEVAYVARRIERAVKTLNAIPDPQPLKGFKVAWPEMPHRHEDAYGYSTVTERFVPTKEDVDTMMDWLDLLAWLDREDYSTWTNIVVMRISKQPWWRISDRLRLGVSEPTIKRWYDSAMVLLWGEARRRKMLNDCA